MINSATELPRVLVITSNNFNLHGGGGITLTNLFRGWPKDCLANLHEDSTLPDRSVCDNFFRLTGREIRWSWPLSLLEKPLTGRDVLEGTTAVAQNAPLRRGFKRRIVSDGLPRSVTITTELERWIDGFHPQLAYGFLGSIAQIRLMRAITRRWHLPIAVHIMDDWPATLYTGGLLGRALRRTMLAEFRELLDRSTLKLAISGAMAAEYERRYGGSFQIFHNALHMEEWLKDARREWSVRTPAAFRYVGSIFAEAQRDAIHDACEAVVQLRAAGRDVRFSVYSPPSQTRELALWGYPREVLDIQSDPDPNHVPKLMAGADVLLLPFNFNEDSARYLRFSMPTKIPAYMISGSPILVYGPRELAAVAYAVDSGWAHVVTEPGAHGLSAGLSRVLDDAVLRRTLGERAQRLAAEFHDISRIRERFWSALSVAARNYEEIFRERVS